MTTIKQQRKWQFTRANENGYRWAWSWLDFANEPHFVVQVERRLDVGLKRPEFHAVPNTKLIYRLPENVQQAINDCPEEWADINS